MSERAAGPVVRFVRLDTGIEAPRAATAGAAAVDLRSTRHLVVPGGANARVPTGVAVELPPGTCGLVVPRSGLAARHALTVTNAPGLIDADFRGEIEVLLVNLGPANVVIERGDRIAQLLVVPVLPATWLEVAVLADSDRGDAGFGSTGVR